MKWIRKLSKAIISIGLSSLFILPVNAAIPMIIPLKDTVF